MDAVTASAGASKKPLGVIAVHLPTLCPPTGVATPSLIVSVVTVVGRRTPSAAGGPQGPRALYHVEASPPVAASAP